MEHPIKTLQYRLELYKTSSKYSPSPYWGEIIEQYEKAIKTLKAVDWLNNTIIKENENTSN